MVEEAATAREGLELISHGSWALVFIDLDLPDRSGLDLLQDLRALVPKVPVLVMSGMPEEEFGERVLKAGAMGFLQKGSVMTEVMIAIRRVCAGQKYISVDLASRLLENSLKPAYQFPHYALSTRELQVLQLIGTAQTVSEIAAALTLSVKTVSTYRTRLMQKLGLHNTAEVIRYALQHGLEK